MLDDFYLYSINNEIIDNKCLFLLFKTNINSIFIKKICFFNGFFLKICDEKIKQALRLHRIDPDNFSIIGDLYMDNKNYDINITILLCNVSILEKSTNYKNLGNIKNFFLWKPINSNNADAVSFGSFINLDLPNNSYNMVKKNFALLVKKILENQKYNFFNMIQIRKQFKKKKKIIDKGKNLIFVQDSRPWYEKFPKNNYYRRNIGAKSQFQIKKKSNYNNNLISSSILILILYIMIGNIY